MAKSKSISLDAVVDIEAASAESTGPRKFESTVYTGGKLVVAGYEMPVVIDLAGLTNRNVLVANLDHKASQRVGNFETVNDGKTLKATGTASAATASRDEVINSAAAGYQWQASVEAVPSKLEVIKAGQTVVVNGQTFTGPLYVARKATLKGFAFVSHGADDETTVSIAASSASHKEKEMKPEIKAWAESMLLDVENLSDEQVAAIEANYEGRQKPAKTKSKVEDVIAAARAEDERKSKIADIIAQAIADNPHRDDEFVTRLQALADNAIEANWSADKFDTEVLRATRPQSHTVWNRSADRRAISAKVIEAALCVSGGLEAAEDIYDDQTLQAAHDRFKSGVGIKQLYRIVAKANGYVGDDDEVTLDMHRYACGLVPGRQINAAGYSTLSLPGILSNTANKFLLEGWGGGDMTWQGVTAKRSVRDFKQVTSYRLGGNFKYVKVGAGAEITHGTVSEDTYTNQAETYGRMFAVSRTDIINDDLSALTGVPRELGFGANDAFNEVFWTEFLDNSTFFASGNNNLATGVFSAAAGLATLAAAETVFMNQTKPNGTPLGVMPDRILVPTGTKRIAMAAMQSSLVVGSSGPTPDANTFKGNYEVLSTPYLSNTAYTGYSTIKWYMLANPSRLAVIETAFLNGREAPVVEQGEQAFNTLGIQMRGYHDFGCNKQEYRAGVQGSGA